MPSTKNSPACSISCGKIVTGRAPGGTNESTIITASANHATTRVIFCGVIRSPPSQPISPRPRREAGRCARGDEALEVKGTGDRGHALWDVRLHLDSDFAGFRLFVTASTDGTAMVSIPT